MSKHEHSHGNAHHHDHTAPRKGFHRSWIFWVAVLLMFVAMLTYVVTNDEAIGLGGEVNQEVPALGE